MNNDFDWTAAISNNSQSSFHSNKRQTNQKFTPQPLVMKLESQYCYSIKTNNRPTPYNATDFVLFCFNYFTISVIQFLFKTPTLATGNKFQTTATLLKIFLRCLTSVVN